MPDPVTGTMAAVAVGGGLMQSSSQKKAASAQERASASAASAQLAAQAASIEEQRRQFDISTGHLRDDYAQDREDNAALRAYKQQASALASRSLPLMEQAVMADYPGEIDVRLNEDPGYQFRLQEGQRALERSAAGRGGLLSGRNVKALQRHGQELGSQEYAAARGRAIDRYNKKRNERADYISNLGQLAGYGRQTKESSQLGSQLSTLGQQHSQNISGILQAGGQVRAGDILSRGNIAAGAYKSDPWAGIAKQAAEDVTYLNRRGAFDDWFGSGSSAAPQYSGTLGSNQMKSPGMINSTFP